MSKEVSDEAALERRRAYGRAYYARNKERIRAQQLEYWRRKAELEQYDRDTAARLEEEAKEMLRAKGIDV